MLIHDLIMVNLHLTFTFLLTLPLKILKNFVNTPQKKYYKFLLTLPIKKF